MKVLVAAIVFLAIAAFPASAQCPAKKKKNLLFITADQFRADALRYAQERRADYAGFEKVDTPNLDALAESGAYFENAYVVSQNCVPSRATFTTGLTLQRSGVTHSNLLSEKVYTRHPSFKERILSSRTYEMILSDELGYWIEDYGKWHKLLLHFYGRKGRAVRFNEYNFNRDEPVFNGQHQQSFPMWRNHFLWLRNQPGFRVTALSNLRNGWQLQGRLPYYPINKLDARYGKPTGFPINQLPAMCLRGQGKMVGRYAWTKQLGDTEVIGKVGVKRLTALAQKSKASGTSCGTPFSLTLHFNAPHPPYIGNEPYFSKYYNKRGKLYTPRNLNDSLGNSAYSVDSCDSKYGIFYSRESDVAGMTASYYATIEELDDWVGKILKVLDDEGIRNDTLVVFTSDHGDNLGAHGLQGKYTLYEETMKVPLLISGPPIPRGTVVTHPVSLIDLVSTILYYLGASQFDETDGRSLHRFIVNRNYEDDLPVVHEIDKRYPINSNTIGGDKPGSQLNFAVIKDGMKLMTTKKRDSTLMDMMFDLDTDKPELNNLLGKRASTASVFTIGRAEYLKAKLIEWLVAKDGKGRYYSSSQTNIINTNDIAEIRARQTWPNTNFWVSHPSLRFTGTPNRVANGFSASKKLYMGHTTSGTLLIDSIQTNGLGSPFISVKCPASRINQGRHIICRVNFASSWKSNFSNISTRIIINYRVGGGQKSMIVWVRGTAP